MAIIGNIGAVGGGWGMRVNSDSPFNDFRQLGWLGV